VNNRIKLDESWKSALKEEFQKPYMTDLRSFLRSELGAGKKIYPPAGQYFAALDNTPISEVKVVIIGQDPYHGPGQAHGLSFSVKNGVRLPPSLQNIFKELQSDLGVNPPLSGDLSSWARQGVLLLNAVLSVEEGLAGSHANKGWETFTDRIIDVLNREREDLVFLLWGAYAQKKGQFIDRKKHLVLSSAHPSPLSASRGFLGSRPFSKINAWLNSHGKTPIDWSAN
jgi:uracil-DNA glycosylase